MEPVALIMVQNAEREMLAALPGGRPGRPGRLTEGPPLLGDIVREGTRRLLRRRRTGAAQPRTAAVRWADGDRAHGVDLG